MKILVLGIGQSLRGDDGAGLEAVRLWQQTHADTAGRVKVEISELPGVGLLEYLQDMEAAILVDAVDGNSPPGTVHRITPEEVDAFRPGFGSAHGWGVAETLELGRSLYPDLARCRITLIGIEAGCMEMGTGLSQPVQESLSKAAKMIEQELQALL
jgi:hydrogenase maturation protease